MMFSDPRGPAAAVAQAQAALDQAEAELERLAARFEFFAENRGAGLGAADGGTRLRRSCAANQPDLAFGAYQRGLYQTAFQEAMKRIDADKP